MTKKPLTEYQKLQGERVTEAADAQALAISRMLTVMREAHSAGLSLQDIADRHPHLNKSTVRRWVASKETE